MILLIGLYRDRAPARMAELLECLGRNLGNPRIAEVHVFLEDGLDPSAYPVLAHGKVRLVPHGRRLTFRDLFAHANRALAGQRVIIANNDIYFDHTLARLDGYELAGKLLCLSRWEMERDGSVRLFEQPWSQDAWIFQAPVPAFASDWHLGLPGCENRLAHEAQQAGLALLNPARTVRAHHLHHSQVRHYTERQRLPGHGRGVEATALGVPWLCPIVTCQGRLADLQETFGALVDQPRASAVLVDYDCPDGSGAWARARHPGATVVAVRDRRWFNAAEARNLGAAAADEDAVLCFLDADVTVSPAFSEEVLARFDPGGVLVPDAAGPGLDSALVCARAAFQRVGGYDTNYLGPGGESDDLRAALTRAGFAVGTFPASLLAHRRHPDAARARLSLLGDPTLPALVDAAYRRLKEAIVAETGDAISRGALREIQRAITHRHLVARGLIPEAPSAAVAFREAMGYTVACLAPGASSHNNDPRPFEEIPPPLAGLAFTQVVASRVSPVRVEFRAGGKLYVLVGTDWHGYRPATAFLREHGYRERVPDVRTRRGTAFEVWSLIGDAGDALDLPTQVMLVARQLVAA